VGARAIDDELAERCHANCIEYSREGARGPGANGEIWERDGVLLLATGSAFPVLANLAFRLDRSVAADDVIAAADAWFAARDRGWSLGTSSSAGADEDLIAAATASGLVTVTDMPGMVCHERVATGEVPEGVDVRILSTYDEAEAFVAMSDLAYTSLGLPAGVIAAMAGSPPPMPINVVSVGAFEDGALIAGAQVVFSHGIAGVYLVGTAEAARGRGLAELVTRTVTNLGFDGGAPYVTLQASPMGQRIYERIGYREVYRYATHTRFV
jgi:ribosomal protein S18 acetylase RimI-like enzyme